MFQKHHGESLYEVWTRSKGLLKKVPRLSNLLAQFQIFLSTIVNQATRGIVDHATSGKLRDKSVDESWEIIEGLVLYDNESWNRNLAKPVKAISLPHDVPRVNHVGRIFAARKIKFHSLMEAQNCSIKPYKAFVNYASWCTDEAGDLVLTDKLVTYDLEKKTIGWTEYNCSSSIKVKDEEPGNMYSAGAHNLSPADRISTSTGIVVSCFMCLQMAKLH
ncbi:MAK10-like protein [Tanacetum coccineum]